MMPRIQFSYDGGDGPEDSVPRRPNSSLVRDAFCNPHTNCSPVCCCCGLLPISIAVKGVVWIAIGFSVWEVSMGSWLLIESNCCLQPMVEDAKISTLGVRQLSKLRAAGWLLVLVGLFRFLGLLYLLYSVSNADRARKLPAIFSISILILLGVILTYPLFISIPGKGVTLSDGSHLQDFQSAYYTGHTLDLLFMFFYSLYTILYYIIVSDYRQRHLHDYDCDEEGGISCRPPPRFEPIDTNVRLT